MGRTVKSSDPKATLDANTGGVCVATGLVVRGANTYDRQGLAESLEKTSSETKDESTVLTLHTLLGFR
jgi:hypothetical protein